jgi:hypothetical protein
MSLEDGGMQLFARIMRSTSNGRDYLLYNVFNFVLVFLMN